MAGSPTRLSRAAFWAVVGLVLLAGAWWMVRPQPVPVDLGTVTRGPLQVTLDHEGQTRVRERYTISAPVSGRVLRIGLEPGDVVQARRTELASLLPVPAPLLDARTRAEADARVKTATAALEQARAALEQAKTAAAFAEQERNRVARLFAAQAVSERERDNAEQEARVRRQAVDVAEAGAAASAHELEVARAALTATADGQRAGGVPVVVRAPIDGSSSAASARAKRSSLPVSRSSSWATSRRSRSWPTSCRSTRCAWSRTCRC
jgi:HlyD family secretion protein